MLILHEFFVFLLLVVGASPQLTGQVDAKNHFIYPPPTESSYEGDNSVYAQNLNITLGQQEKPFEWVTSRKHVSLSMHQEGDAIVAHSMTFIQCDDDHVGSSFLWDGKLNPSINLTLGSVVFLAIWDCEKDGLPVILSHWINLLPEADSAIIMPSRSSVSSTSSTTSTPASSATGIITSPTITSTTSSTVTSTTALPVSLFTSPPSSDDNHSDNENNNTTVNSAAIGGGVGGGVGGAILVVGLIFLCMKHRKEKKQEGAGKEVQGQAWSRVPSPPILQTDDPQVYKYQYDYPDPIRPELPGHEVASELSGPEVAELEANSRISRYPAPYYTEDATYMPRRQD
ncbi:hypothetical protein GGS20DRAFT_310991 [Poronia punctata]|nr:hypothetical protein GGS20DRAFT_310991 [Poronia punctata]